MAGNTPLETIDQLITAFKNGHVDTALALYDPEGMFITDGGEIVRGPTALRQVLEGFAAIKPTLTTHRHKVIEAGEIALYYSHWTMNGTAPDGSPVSQEGQLKDVLKRMPDGRWLILVDNPMGIDLLNT